MVDGLRRDHEPAGDLRVGRAGRHEAEHLGLARREARRRGAGRGRGPRGIRRTPAARRRAAQVQGGARVRRSSSKTRERVERAPRRRGVASARRRHRTGQRSADQAACAPLQSPAIERAYGSATLTGGASSAPARQSHSASSPRAHTLPRLAASGYALARAAAAVRRRPRRATRSPRAPPRPARSRCSSWVATARRQASSSVVPRLPVATPRPGGGRARSAPGRGSRRAARRGRARRGRRPRPPATRRAETEVRRARRGRTARTRRGSARGRRRARG